MHDDDHDEGERRAERPVGADAAELVGDDVADHDALGAADQRGGDEIAGGEQEREGEGGADAGQRHRQEHGADEVEAPRAEILRHLEIVARDVGHRRIDRQHRERQEQPDQRHHHGEVAVDQEGRAAGR